SEGVRSERPVPIRSRDRPPVLSARPLRPDPERERAGGTVGEDPHHPLPLAAAIAVQIHVAAVRIERIASPRRLEPVDRASVEAGVPDDVLVPPLAAHGLERQLRRRALPAREAKLDGTVDEPPPRLAGVVPPVRRLADDNRTRGADGGRGS